MSKKNNNDISKEFVVTVWDTMNVCLAIATAISTIVFVFLFVFALLKN